MKHLVFILIGFYLLLLGCKNDSEKCILSKHFEEKEYALINTANDRQGNKYLELYKHKVDSNRFFTKIFWDNGNLQGAIFYTGKTKDGPFRMYDTLGQVVFDAMYIDDIKNGLAFYYKAGVVTDFSIFYKGEDLPLDSSAKKQILAAYSNKIIDISGKNRN